jgi:hypothetical protein
MSGKLSCQGGGNCRSRAQNQYGWHAPTSSVDDGHDWSEISLLAQVVNFFVGGEEKIHHRGHGDHGAKQFAISLRTLWSLW